VTAPKEEFLTPKSNVTTFAPEGPFYNRISPKLENSPESPSGRYKVKLINPYSVSYTFASKIPWLSLVPTYI
jgi:hypothetical protein